MYRNLMRIAVMAVAAGPLFVETAAADEPQFHPPKHRPRTLESSSLVNWNWGWAYEVWRAEPVAEVAYAVEFRRDADSSWVVFAEYDTFRAAAERVFWLTEKGYLARIVEFSPEPAWELWSITTAFEEAVADYDQLIEQGFLAQIVAVRISKSESQLVREHEIEVPGELLSLPPETVEDLLQMMSEEDQAATPPLK